MMHLVIGGYTWTRSGDQTGLQVCRSVSLS
uniref:Uncharacterized protein n=1 Tax=Anguilla anguilla TaxID=7936 RepID=A0A0E9QED8_ANGAN